MTPWRTRSRRTGMPRLVPFASVALLAFALIPLPPSGTEPLAVAAAMALTAAIGVFALALPWRSLPATAAAVPPLLFLPAVAFLRQAEGGAASGYAPLVLLPVIWLALYGRRRDLGAAIVLAGACLAAPIVAYGEPLYPTTEWRRMLLLVTISAVVGFTVQGLVRRQLALSAELRRLSHADHLTGLPNRRAFDARLQAEILRAERHGGRLCVAHLDLDRFKEFNDTFGHPAGDKLLQDCAAAWLASLRATDVLARYGGDEFAILLPETTLDQALVAAERVRAATPGGQRCSIGVAELDEGATGDTLLARADAALYAAKAAGRDRVAH